MRDLLTWPCEEGCDCIENNHSHIVDSNDIK